MDVKAVLESMVYAGRKAYKLNKEMNNLGYGDNPYLDIYSGIADAIYCFLGESCDFEESATAVYLTDLNTSDEQCIAGLFAVHAARNSEPQLSDTTMEILRHEAEQKGIPVQNMISLILAEWVMRRECVKNFTKAV